MLNVVALMGRLVANPELRHTASGLAVVNFTLAVQRKISNADPENSVDFIDIVAWRNNAEFVAKYFTKGLLVGVDGYIQTRKYQDKDGFNRKVFEIIANNVHFGESKRSADAYNSENQNNILNEPSENYKSTAPFNNENDDDFAEIPADDDLPF